MNWRRACWSNRLQTLFGSRKDRYKLQQARLLQHVYNWYNASRKEALIDKSKLATKWLDHRSDDRAKITNLMKSLTQTTGQLSIFSYIIPSENRRQNNQAFQTCIQEARRASLSTSSGSIIRGTPGLNRAYIVYHLHCYIQV